MTSPDADHRPEQTFRAALDHRFGDAAAAPGDEPACDRLARLLGLLGPSPGEIDAARRTKATRVDVVLARVARDQRHGAARLAHGAPVLDAASASAADALLDTAADPSAAESSRAHRLGALLQLIAEQPATDAERRDRLVDRTLARVQQEIDSAAGRFRLDPVLEPALRGGRGFRLPDLVGIAAMLIIGAAILWPSFVASRGAAREIACQSNMSRAGVGFGLFAGSNDGHLPSVEQRAEQPVLWRVGDRRHSHSANLFLLVRDGYVRLGTLACPCNECAPVTRTSAYEADWLRPEEVSYSYQVFGHRAPRLTDPSLEVVLTDRSPVIERARRGERFDPLANSRNHGGSGQAVLMRDQSVVFLRTPVLRSGDNIWLPAAVERLADPTLRGTEVPDGVGDAFVGP